jgi:hypothetical protein
MVMAGMAGLYLAWHLWPSDAKDPGVVLRRPRPIGRLLIDSGISILASCLIGYIGLSALARGTEIIGASISTQPATSQIAFAATVAFWLAGLASARVLRVGPFCPIIATAILPTLAFLLLARPEVIGPVAMAYPATCLPQTVLGILPIQTVSFGTIGAIAGYWTAVRIEYWRRHLEV